MPARGGFSPSRSFSAAFSLSSLCKRLLLRREAVKKCEKVKILKNAKMSPSCTLTVTESARPKACLITILCWEASLVLTCFDVVLVLTCFDVILVSICFSVILVLTLLKIGLTCCLFLRDKKCPLIVGPKEEPTLESYTGPQG